MWQRQQAVAADRQAKHNLVEGLSQRADEKQLSGPVSEIVRFTRPLVSDLFRKQVPSGIYG